jgi:tripartite ATP-independent transporter DctP family solute receptor
MMMLKKFRCLVLTMVLVIVVFSCSTFAAKKPIKLVFGHIWNADHFLTKGDLYFKKLVEKNSKRQILIDYYPGAQLGNGQEANQATKTGAQQMTLCSFGGLTPYWQKLATFNLPYIYRDTAHIQKVAEKINFLLDKDEMATKTGMYILYLRPLPARHLTTNVPVNKIEDIKGLKIRSPENPITVALIKSWDAIPTVVPFAETYTALASGTVDAQENPLNDIYAMKFHEQQKYCALTAHMQEIVCTLINAKCWNSLTKAQKKILTNAADQCVKMGLKDMKEAEEGTYNILVKAGMKFTRPDVAPFREKAKKTWSKLGDKKLIDKIQAIK